MFGYVNTLRSMSQGRAQYMARRESGRGPRQHDGLSMERLLHERQHLALDPVQPRLNALESRSRFGLQRINPLPVPCHTIRD